MPAEGRTSFSSILPLIRPRISSPLDQVDALAAARLTRWDRIAGLVPARSYRDVDVEDLVVERSSSAEALADRVVEPIEEQVLRRKDQRRAVG
jgi:hypothetical protein